MITMTKKDNDLKRNGSGYYDEPCYQTVTAPPKPGEIWMHSNGAYILVIASRGSVYSTLRLTDMEREGSVTVMCKTPMYTAPIMIGYCFEETLTEFVKTISQEEFKEVRKAVAKALGVYAPSPLPSENTDIVQKMHERVQALTDENEGLKKSYKDVFKENEKLHFDLKAMAIAEGERDEMFRKMDEDLTKANVYKEMYLELLDKLISARAVL